MGKGSLKSTDRQTGSPGTYAIITYCFAVLPIRGLLYALTSLPMMLVAIQILDDFGLGIFGVLSSLIVLNLTRGFGLFNTTQGDIATAIGLGDSD